MGILESIESRWESGNLVQAVASSLVRWTSRYEKSANGYIKILLTNPQQEIPTRPPRCANKWKQSARRRVSQNWQRGKYNFWSGQVSHYWRSWVDSFQPGYWCLILHAQREWHLRVPVSTKGKYQYVPLTQRWCQYPREVPMSCWRVISEV